MSTIASARLVCDHLYGADLDANVLGTELPTDFISLLLSAWTCEVPMVLDLVGGDYPVAHILVNR